MGDESSDEYIFEFVQDGEFADPYYVIRDMEDGVTKGNLQSIGGYWYAQFSPNYAHSDHALGWVAEKIAELDVETYKQRIKFFGWSL